MALRIVLGVQELDRLIGGDTEVELELRKGVVENFARQKLASLFDHPEVQATLQSLSEHARQEVSDRIGRIVREEKYPHRGVWQLVPAVKDTLEQAIQQAVSAHVAQATEDIERRINDEVNRRVAEMQRRALRTVADSVGARFKKEVDDEVNRIITAAYAAASE